MIFKVNHQSKFIKNLDKSSIVIKELYFDQNHKNSPFREPKILPKTES